MGKEETSAQSAVLAMAERRNRTIMTNQELLPSAPTFPKTDGWLLLLLSILAAAFFYPIVFEGHLPLDEDSLLFFYPLRLLHADPSVGLWDPYLFCGFPRDANPQSQILYWPNFVMKIFPSPWGCGLLLIGHYVLGGWLMLLLLRGLGLRPSASFFGALVFLLSAFWRCKITNMGLLEGISWLPGALYFYLSALERKKIASCLPAAFFLSMTILAGVPHTAIYAFLLLLILSIFYGARRSSALFAASAWILTVGASVLLTAGMWLPALLYASETLRGRLDFAEAMAGSLDWRQIWKSFFGGLSQPEISRCDPWEGTCYIGITALFFIPKGWKRVSAPLRYSLASAVVLAVLLTLGDDGFLSHWLYNWLPGWNRFNLPNRSLLMAAIALPIFSAFGFQAWLEVSEKSRRVFYGLLVCSSLCLFVYLLSAAFDPWVWRTTVHSAMTKTFIPDSLSDGRWAILMFCFWAGLTGFVLLAFYAKKIQPGLAAFLLSLLLIAQSMQYGQRLFLQTASPDFFDPPASVRNVQKKITPKEFSRIAGFAPFIDAGSDVRVKWIRPALMHRLSEVFRLYDVQGYDPAAPRRYAELLSAWAGQSPASDSNRTVRLKTLPPALLNLLGVKYVIGYPNYESLYMGRSDQTGPCRLETAPAKPVMAEAIQFRWLMAGASGLAQGSEAGRVNILRASQTVESFPIRVGVDIANYILENSRHRPAGEYRWFPIPSENGYAKVRQYLADYPFSASREVDRVAVEFDAPVRYSLFEVALMTKDKKGLVLSPEKGELPIYVNPAAFPAVYLTRNLSWYENMDEIVAGMNQRQPGEEIPAFLHKGEEIVMEKSPLQSEQSAENAVEFTRPDSDRFFVHVKAKYDGLLVVTENYSPYWRADVDGKPSPVVRANYAFMALPVASGEHTVQLVYSPRPYFIGCFVSAGALMVLLMLMALTAREWLKPAAHKTSWSEFKENYEAARHSVERISGFGEDDDR